MTSYLEEQLMAGMRDEVAGTALSGGVLGAARHRHQRRTAVRRTMYAAGVAGLAGVTALAVALGGSNAGAGTRGGADGSAAVAAETPELRLASAIAASQNTSYKIKVTVPRGGSSVDTTEGAFDPVTRTGYLSSKWSGADVVYYERLVDGTRYTGASGMTVWDQLPGTFDRLAYDRSMNGHPNDPLGASAGASADPQQLLAELRKAGTKITQSGAAFHFEITLKPETTPRTTLKQSIAGDITLDADKRIATIAYTRTVRATKDNVSAGADVTKVTMAFSDYGAPVTVERPAKAVVVK